MMNLELFKNLHSLDHALLGSRLRLGILILHILNDLDARLHGILTLEVGLQRLIISAFPLVLGAFVGYAVGQIGSRLFASGSLLIEAVGFLQ